MRRWNRILCGGVLLAVSSSLVTGTSRELTAASQEADTTITIRAVGSTMEFTPTRVSAKAGTRVRLRFVNDGTLPHNVTIPKNEKELDGIALAAYSAGETGYVPLNLKDKLVAWSPLASPGQSVEMVFVVPAAGEYTYVCLFPGHSNSMIGTLRALK